MLHPASTAVKVPGWTTNVAPRRRCVGDRARWCIESSPAAPRPVTCGTRASRNAGQCQRRGVPMREWVTRVQRFEFGGRHRWRVDGRSGGSSRGDWRRASRLSASKTSSDAAALHRHNPVQRRTLPTAAARPRRRIFDVADVCCTQWTVGTRCMLKPQRLGRLAVARASSLHSPTCPIHS